MYIKSSFCGKSLFNLFTKIIQNNHKPINSSRYSQDLSAIVDSILSKDPEKRPSINQLLSLPNICKWIPRLLSKQIIDVEFPEGIKNRVVQVKNTIHRGENPRSPGIYTKKNLSWSIFDGE
ncbi:Kinase [Hexamita inflata]|uniref:non-specific serine/threonine protein kinase n=1 Tax=Hexamita inflata TaxID=28002 RepID=A0AA86UI26_9EUKA|nr:Kinase [Hexamita inflata]